MSCKRELTNRNSGNTSSSPAIYRELCADKKEIRLLEVQPGKPEDSIHGSFKYTCLKHEGIQQYETISYVWGDASQRSITYVDGRPLDVPKSAKVALKRMRHHNRPRLLWIDAVCINQADTAERASQVALMAEIFSYTTLNLIWLGNFEGGDLKASIRAIHMLVDDMRNETDGFKDARTVLYDTNHNFRYSETPIFVEIDWPAVARFFEVPWFRRLWVIQEASLPDRSICFVHDQEIPLEDVVLAVIWLYHKFYASNTRWQRLPRGLACAIEISAYGKNHVGFNRVSQQDVTCLGVLVDIAGNFTASDSRDYVYGRLGLLQKCRGYSEIPLDLVPNYDMPAAQVFRNTTRWLIVETRSLSILRYVRRRRNGSHSPDMPSWVATWHISFDGDLDPVQLAWTRADGGISLDVTAIRTAHDANVLSLKGVKVGMLACLSRTFHKYDLDSGGLLVYQQLMKDAYSVSGALREEYPVSLPALVAHSLLGGEDGMARHVDVAQSAVLCDAFLHEIFEVKRLPPSVQSSASDARCQVKNAASFHQAIYNSCRNRRMFRTDSGHFGIGPSGMEFGDVVAVLFGCDNLCVLRPLDRQENAYEFIGLCFISEIMNGEAVDAWKARGDSADQFNLH